MWCISSILVKYMVQAMINISENANQILNIVKAKFGLKDKSEAIDMMANQYEEEILEPELKPEFVKKVLSIKKTKGKTYKNLAELRKEIENA